MHLHSRDSCFRSMAACDTRVGVHHMRKFLSLAVAILAASIIAAAADTYPSRPPNSARIFLSAMPTFLSEFTIHPS